MANVETWAERVARSQNLAAMNENPYTRNWGDFSLRTEYRVGRYGYRASGKHSHLIVVEIITEDRSATPGRSPSGGRRLTTGDALSTHPFCNGDSGQHSGRPSYRGDLGDITCAKCRKALGLG